MGLFPAPTATYHHKPYPAIDPARPELSAKGKSIVITGGGTGIGAETARYFAKAGASRILIIGRREGPLIDTKASISSEFPDVNITFAQADTTNKPAIDAAFAHFSKNGKINVLVSNAAVLGPKAQLKDADADEWIEGIVVNVKGSFIVAQSFIKHAAPGAVIINVSSASWHIETNGLQSSYGAAKAASLRFFHALAIEYPELFVYNLQPGIVMTDAAQKALELKEGEDLSPTVKMLMDIQDTVELPAAYCVWLASPEAEFLRGKFVWANWDIDELRARKSELEKGWLDFGVLGWPFA